MEQEEKLPYYVHKDISGLSFEEFSDRFDAPIPTTESFIENLEWALMYLDMNKSGTPFGYDESRKHFFSLSTFDGAYLMNVGKLGAEGNEKDDLHFYNPIFENFDLSMFKAWNSKIMYFGEGDDMRVQLKKLRILEQSDRRNFDRAVKEYRTFPIAEESFAFLSKDEKWYTMRQEYALWKKQIQTESGNISPFVPIPISVNPKYYVAPKDQKDFIQGDEFWNTIKRVNMALSARFTMYYEWFVYIRENPTSIGVKVPITPESSKDVFALRDIPEGGKRKKAICNFVRQHYRTVKCNYDPGERDVLVKKHLRGETKFNWRGLELHIIPAEYDLNRIRTSKKFLKK